MDDLEYMAIFYCPLLLLFTTLSRLIMTILSNVDYFKELSFFNVFIEKPKIKHLKDIDLLAKLPFYNQLDI